MSAKIVAFDAVEEVVDASQGAAQVADVATAIVRALIDEGYLTDDENMFGHMVWCATEAWEEVAGDAYGYGGGSEVVDATVDALREEGFFVA